MASLIDSYNKWRGQQGENSAAGSNTITEDEEKKVTVIGKVEETEKNTGPKNVGGFGGGLEYLGTKLVDGLVSNVEGIVDFVAGGIAEIGGNDEKAQEIFQNDWYNYNRADEKYNPGTGMKVAGDISSVLGGALPDIGAGIALALAGAPAAVAAIVGAGLSFTSGSGRGINEAVNTTGELGSKEWAGGMGTGALAAGIELASAGLGSVAGGMFGKTTAEIGMEIGESFSKRTSSKAIGGALGEVAEEGSEATAKNIIQKIFTSKSGKELVGEMVSEGIEESIETIIDPSIKQNTYDPDAPNATLGDVGYSFLLGSAGGGLIKGSQVGINSTVNTIRGGKISADSTKMNNLMHNAQVVSSYESEKQTGSELFRAVTNLYNEIQQKLAASDGKVSAGTMEKIGQLDRMVTTSALLPSMVNAAKGVAQNAESMADALNNFYKKTGQNTTITAEQLTAGLVMDKGSQAFVRSVEKAMSTNGLLRTVVINNMLGRMEFDSRSFANSIYGDIDISSIATQQNLNRFLSTADAATLNQLGAALGISNWAAVTPEELAARIKAFRDSGQAEMHRGGYEAIEKAKRAKGYTNGMPTSISSLKRGATRFKTDKSDFAIVRDGDKFRLYDFETGHVTNAMSLADMEALVARLNQRAAEIDAESEMAALDRELNDFANENVPEYKKLTEAEKEAVRATLRSARANGISVKDQILFGRIAAKSGMNIIVDPTIDADKPARYDGRNTIYINPKSPRTRLYSGLLGHEVFHKMFRSPKVKRLFMQAWNNIDEGKRQSVINRYMSELKKYDTTLDERIDIANEEVAAAYAEEVFNNPGVWEYILSEEPSLKDRVIAFFKGSPKRYSFAPEMDAAAKKWIQEYKKLFDQVAARNVGNNVASDVGPNNKVKQITRLRKIVEDTDNSPKRIVKLGKLAENEQKDALTPEQAKVNDKIGDARFSLEYAEDIAARQRKYAEDGLSSISIDEIEKAASDTAFMVEMMRPHADILPQDKIGKTLVKNGSYDISVENTTICIRTLAYNSFVDMVSEKVGRPLTQMESFLVSQKLYEIAKEPQCLYCYVSLDRKAFNEMVIRYVEQRDEAIFAYKDAGSPKIPATFNPEWPLFKEFLAGRKPTKNMWDRYTSWINNFNNGKRLVDLNDISTEAKRLKIVEEGGNASAQVKDILKYAQSASWAKKQTEYVAYNDEILRLKPSIIRNLNSHYGMRWYSFSDYSGAFIVENMQQITDASIRGLKGLSYTKDTDFAEIFAPTGMNINISVYAKKVDGGYEIDAKQSASIEDAIRLRKKFPNVGIVVVATDKGGVEWALEQEWSDVVIPFHTVRTGADVAEFYNWEIFNTEQSDVVSDENLWNQYVDNVGKKKVSKMVYPSEHQNNRERYLSICKERGLTPRFNSFIDNPNYMKLVNETRQSEAATKPLKPSFDLKAAERAFKKFVKKGGYYEGWYNDGIDVDNEADIVATDVLSGKKANEVTYGRQDIDLATIGNRKKKRIHGERFALAEEDFYASGEEFASPTISTVGKDRVNYEEKFGSKEWRKTKSESAYIHAVDEMYGIQSYLEKVGKRKNAKATIQTVRSTPHMVQTMVGSVQYNVFHSDSKTAKKMGDGLNVIWKPIKKLGAKAEIDFNDYLLHYLNVDKYGVMERVKKGDQDAAESLRQVRREIDSLETQRSSQEERIFKLGNEPKDMLIKKSIKRRIEEIDKKIIQARADEIALIGESPSYAEAELKRVRNEIASLLSEKERAKAEIFTLGNDEISANRKTELKDRMAEIDKKIKRLSESAAAMEEIAKSYKLAIKPVFSLDGETIGKKQSEAIIKKYEEQYPEFKAIAEKIWKFSKNLNEMRVSAGLMSQSMAARLATMYPHYVPSFKAKINNAAKGDDGIAVLSTVKKAKGYNSNIMDVKESLATQVTQVIRNGNINMLATKVYDTAVKTGDAKYVDIKLPDVEGADLSTEGIERPKPHTIKFFKDGKPFEMNVSDEIYQGFKGISEQSAPRTNVFARATNKISNLYKKLVTSLSPAFMIRNAIRDIQDAGLNSKHPALFVKNIPRAWSELIKNSKNWQTYRAYGGFSSTVFDSKGISNEVGERGFEVLGISERIASGKGLSIKDAKYIKSLLTGVENLNAIVEQIPRFAEYLSSIEAGETIEQAVYNSAEVTTNFARRGATTKAFNSTIIPFLNPAIQGFDKIFRNFTDATKAGSGKEVVKALSTLLCKAIMIGIVPMMFNSIMYSDDEDYEDLREEDKENNYLIKLPNGTFIKLPRGRVASVIGGLYNRAARTVTGKDADWKGYLSNVVSQVTPAENLTRTVFSPFVDVATNRTWYGTEIEGAQFENVRPGDRYDESTSSIAIAIGQAINYSPKKIHYLIDQYSGVIGDFLLPATTKKAEKDFFSGNFTIDPVTSNKLSNKFYEIYDEAQYTRTDGDIKAQYQVKYLNRAKSAVSEMYKQINEIQNSNISNFEKLQQVRVIRVLINEVMKNAVADYEEINKAIDKTANMGFDDSKASDVAVRYAYIVKEVYGAERALYEYNDDVYSKMTVLNTADISYDVLFDYYFGVKNLTSDVDEKGNTISGSKRGKVVAAINGLDISEEEKLLLIATHGYGLKDGDVGGMSKTAADRVLFNYIASLGLSKEEMLKLYEYAGYDVENGEASGSIASGGSSSGSSSTPTLGGNRSGSGRLGGSTGRLGGPSRLGSATLGSTTKNRIKRLGKLV